MRRSARQEAQGVRSLETSTRGANKTGIRRNESGGWEVSVVRVKGNPDRRGGGGEGGIRQRDFTGSETCDEEDVEPPLFDPIPRDPRFLLPQFHDE